MEADNDHADNKSDTYLPLALSCGTGMASVDAAQEAAASALADWHREAQDGKQRQFSIYMNRKRYVVPEGGLKSVPTVPFTKQQGLVALTRNAIRKSIGDPATAVSLPSPGESSNWMHPSTSWADMDACIALNKHGEGRLDMAQVVGMCTSSSGLPQS